MTEMGMGDFCQHIESFNVEKLMDQFSDLVEERARFCTANGTEEYCLSGCAGRTICSYI